MWQAVTWGFETITLGGLHLNFLQRSSDAKCPCVDPQPRIWCMPVGPYDRCLWSILRAEMGLARAPRFFPFVPMLFAWICISSGHEEQSLSRSLCHVPTFCRSLPSASSELVSEEPRLQPVPEQAKVFFGKKQKSLLHGAPHSSAWPRAALSYSTAEEHLFCLNRFINQILLYSCLLFVITENHTQLQSLLINFPEKLCTAL